MERCRGPWWVLPYDSQFVARGRELLQNTFYLPRAFRPKRNMRALSLCASLSPSLSLTLSLSLCFNSHFPGGTGLSVTTMSPIWNLLELGTIEVAVTTGVITDAKLRLNRHCQQTNTQLFYRPTKQQCQIAEWKRNMKADGVICLPRALCCESMCTQSHQCLKLSSPFLCYLIIRNVHVTFAYK